MIFISYSRKDVAKAEAVHAALKEWGYEVFRDRDRESGLTPGRLWVQQLYRELRRSEALVVLCSEHSFASRWCIAELTIAHMLGKAIFPVRIDGHPLDEVVKGYNAVEYGELDRLKDALSRGRQTLSSGQSPFPGLRPYEEADAAVFCGREDDIARGLRKIAELPLSSERFLVVVGPSGSGKSSLLRAGWLPKLRNEPSRWLVSEAFRPQDAPFFWLTRALPPSVRPADGEIRTSSALAEISRRWRAERRAQDAYVVIAIDQLEELIRPAAREVAKELLTALRDVLVEPAQVLVVATLRSEHFAGFQELAAAVELPYESFSLGGLSPARWREIIETPASLAGMEVEPGFVEEALQGIDSPDALPLLAKALEGVWRLDHEKHRLTIASLRSLGGVLGAIDQDATNVVRDLDAAALEPLRATFLLLAESGPDRTWVRRSARWQELPQGARSQLRALETARLLVSDRETVRVAHEAVFRRWEQLAHWLEEQREDVDLQGRLLDDAREWDAAGRPPHHAVFAAWSGARLQRASRPFGGSAPELQGGFIQRASQLANERLRADAKALNARRDAANRRLKELDAAADEVEFSNRLTASERRERYRKIEGERVEVSSELASLPQASASDDARTDDARTDTFSPDAAQSSAKTSIA